VTFPKGGYSFKNVLPHFSNFADWCVRLLGADLGSFQLKVGAAAFVCNGCVGPGVKG
jgi:hypothetical protein